MKYVNKDFYNEWLEFEYEGKNHTVNLRGVNDNGAECKGSFEFRGAEYTFSLNIIDDIVMTSIEKQNELHKKDIKGILIEKIDHLETSRGIAFRAPFTIDGVVAGVIENGGDGGMTTIDFENKEAKLELHKRMMEYFKEIGIEGDEDEYGEEIFVEHLQDMYDFGKILTQEEKLKFLMED